MKKFLLTVGFVATVSVANYGYAAKDRVTEGLLSGLDESHAVRARKALASMNYLNLGQWKGLVEAIIDKTRLSAGGSGLPDENFARDILVSAYRNWKTDPSDFLSALSSFIGVIKEKNGSLSTTLEKCETLLKDHSSTSSKWDAISSDPTSQQLIATALNALERHFYDNSEVHEFVCRALADYLPRALSSDDPAGGYPLPSPPSDMTKGQRALASVRVFVSVDISWSNFDSILGRLRQLACQGNAEEWRQGEDVRTKVTDLVQKEAELFLIHVRKGTDEPIVSSFQESLQTRFGPLDNSTWAEYAQSLQTIFDKAAEEARQKIQLLNAEDAQKIVVFDGRARDFHGTLETSDLFQANVFKNLAAEIQDLKTLDLEVKEAERLGLIDALIARLQTQVREESRPFTIDDYATLKSMKSLANGYYMEADSDSTEETAWNNAKRQIKNLLAIHTERLTEELSKKIGEATTLGDLEVLRADASTMGRDAVDVLDGAETSIIEEQLAEAENLEGLKTVLATLSELSDEDKVNVLRGVRVDGEVKQYALEEYLSLLGKKIKLQYEIAHPSDRVRSTLQQKRLEVSRKALEETNDALQAWLNPPVDEEEKKLRSSMAEIGIFLAKAPNVKDPEEVKQAIAYLKILRGLEVEADNLLVKNLKLRYASAFTAETIQRLWKGFKAKQRFKGLIDIVGKQKTAREIRLREAADAKARAEADAYNAVLRELHDIGDVEDTVSELESQQGALLALLEHPSFNAMNSDKQFDILDRINRKIQDLNLSEYLAQDGAAYRSLGTVDLGGSIQENMTILFNQAGHLEKTLKTFDSEGFNLLDLWDRKRAVEDDLRSVQEELAFYKELSSEFSKLLESFQKEDQDSLANILRKTMLLDSASDNFKNTSDYNDLKREVDQIVRESINPLMNVDLVDDSRALDEDISYYNRERTHIEALLGQLPTGTLEGAELSQFVEHVKRECGKALDTIEYEIARIRAAQEAAAARGGFATETPQEASPGSGLGGFEVLENPSPSSGDDTSGRFVEGVQSQGASETAGAPLDPTLATGTDAAPAPAPSTSNTREAGDESGAAGGSGAPNPVAVPNSGAGGGAGGDAAVAPVQAVDWSKIQTDLTGGARAQKDARRNLRVPLGLDRNTNAEGIIDHITTNLTPEVQDRLAALLQTVGSVTEEAVQEALDTPPAAVSAHTTDAAGVDDDGEGKERTAAAVSTQSSPATTAEWFEGIKSSHADQINNLKEAFDDSDMSDEHLINLIEKNGRAHIIKAALETFRENPTAKINPATGAATDGSYDYETFLSNLTGFLVDEV